MVRSVSPSGFVTDTGPKSPATEPPPPRPTVSMVPPLSVAVVDTELGVRVAATSIVSSPPSPSSFTVESAAAGAVTRMEIVSGLAEPLITTFCLFAKSTNSNNLLVPPSLISSCPLVAESTRSMGPPVVESLKVKVVTGVVSAMGSRAAFFSIP